MSILHVNSSARLSHSNTRTIGEYLVGSLGRTVVNRDLAQNPLPQISAEDLISVHRSSNGQSASLRTQLALSKQLIDELKTADTLVLGSPMYNFGIPATLKQWVDCICRAGVSFEYTKEGPVGLLGIERAFIITASGGTPIGSEVDFASRYLEHICHFIGIPKVFHIDASGSKCTPEQLIAEGKKQVDDLLGIPFNQTFYNNKTET